jgi:hypothetical protein
MPPPIPLPGSPPMPGSLPITPPSQRPHLPPPSVSGPPNQRPGPAVARAGAPQARPQRRGGERHGKPAKADAGKPTETIPRLMRVGKTVRADVRVAKATVEALTQSFGRSGAGGQPKGGAAKAITARVRAPEGGFFVEAASPETQWIENESGYPSDDFASWRFLITPQLRGWSPLQIIVSARFVGADGVAAEMALPDQIVEVKVRRNIKSALMRLVGWSIAALLGGLIGAFGPTGLAIGKILMQRFMH